MTDLHRKPTGANGKVHDITATSAGWQYIGFGLYRLAPGEAAAESTGDREVLLVLVEGKAEIAVGNDDFGELGERMDVFERTKPWCVYVPNGADWRARATTPCTLAVCMAPGHGGHSARIIGPDDITDEARVRAPTPARSMQSPWSRPTSPTAFW